MAKNVKWADDTPLQFLTFVDTDFCYFLLVVLQAKHILNLLDYIVWKQRVIFVNNLWSQSSVQQMESTFSSAAAVAIKIIKTGLILSLEYSHSNAVDWRVSSVARECSQGLFQAFNNTPIICYTEYFYYHLHYTKNSHYKESYFCVFAENHAVTCRVRQSAVTCSVRLEPRHDTCWSHVLHSSSSAEALVDQLHHTDNYYKENKYASMYARYFENFLMVTNRRTCDQGTPFK